MAGLRSSDRVLEVGPGLGSLTLGLLEAGHHVVAVELDERLARALPQTVAAFAPNAVGRLRVVTADALEITPADLAGPDLTGPDLVGPDPFGPDLTGPDVAGDNRTGADRTARDVAPADSAPRDLAPAVGGLPNALVANLPYNVAVPVLLHLLEAVPSIERALVMVQQEVADRLAAGPGSRTYGVPSVKAAWYASVRPAGSVSRSVFWPSPNVDSGLVALNRRDPPPATAPRAAVFAVVDAAFATRRKALRGALTKIAGSADRAEQVLRAAGVDPGMRGETLAITDFARIADALAGVR